MATTTPNYGLRKPARADLVNVITDLNDNMDILDGVVLDNDNRPIVVPLDTVTNVSGSYTHTTTISTANLVTSRMKAIKLELADPSVFRDKIIVTVADDEVTLSCDDVVGTSDVTVTLMRVTPLASAEFHPPYMTSDEFDEMAARVGDLSDLDTTDKDCVVDAVNEVKGITDTLNSNMPTLILRALYPVGSIYMSFNNSIPTALSSIGTWTAVTGGYCLKTITTGTGGTLSNAGNTGSTTLTAAQSGLPKHKHTMTSRNGASAGSYFAAPPMSSNTGSAWTASDWCGETGGTSATEGHTHTAGMPSNVAVYMWKRTA